MYPRALVMLVSLLFAAPSTPQTSESAVAAGSNDAHVLQAIVVSGEQPGPELWKVYKGDHVMWVLGTLTPVPKRMLWQSHKVEAVIAQSQEVLLGGSVTMKSGKGIFATLLLVPSMLGARNNPQKESLAEVVPAAMYARWLVLKHKYLGQNRTVEKRRPIFAAYELYEKAIAKSGLSNAGLVTKVVKKTAKRHDIPVTVPLVKITLKDPKGMIKEFKKSSLDDVECFAKTLQHLESDLETMKDRANAWATGDTALLQELSYTDQVRTCVTAVLDAAAFEGEDFAGLPERVKAEWLNAAEAALSKNKSTFAALPMRELVDSDGYLAALREKGYRVETPEQQANP